MKLLKKGGRRWHVAFLDHTGRERQIIASVDEHESEKLGRELERLAAYRRSHHEPIPAASWIALLHERVSSAPGRLGERLVEWGLLDPPQQSPPSPGSGEYLDDDEREGFEERLVELRSLAAHHDHAGWVSVDEEYALLRELEWTCDILGLEFPEMDRFVELETMMDLAREAEAAEAEIEVAEIPDDIVERMSQCEGGGGNQPDWTELLSYCAHNYTNYRELLERTSDDEAATLWDTVTKEIESELLVMGIVKDDRGGILKYPDVSTDT
jgi:hypothetical protein